MQHFCSDSDIKAKKMQFSLLSSKSNQLAFKLIFFLNEGTLFPCVQEKLTYLFSMTNVYLQGEDLKNI